MNAHSQRPRLLHFMINGSRALTVLAVAVFGAASLDSQQNPQSPRELDLTVGKSLVVNSAANIQRIAVGYGDVAEARAIGPTEVLLNGKAPGETTLIIWQEGGNKLFFDVVVRPNTSTVRARIDALRNELQQFLPGQNINVTFENDTLFLQGSVKDVISADRAVAIASATNPKVINLLYVNVPASDAQVLLKVQFATVDRSVVTDLGLNLFSNGAANTLGGVTTGQYPSAVVTPPTTPGAPSNLTLSQALNIFLFRPGINLGLTIKDLETRGLAEILAEPNVLAINGKQASFLSGGEFPYPILQGGGLGLGQVTVAFRQFGVRIDFLPVITARNTIRLDVAPEVSSLDFTNGLTLQGFTIPGLASRRVETEIELSSGQSFAIGGLLDRRTSETLNKIPGLASIPLLGKIFTSRNLTKSNSELLVLITPEIVHPVEQSKAPHLDFPYPFYGPDQLPRTPGIDVTGTPPTSAEQVPLEQYLRDLRIQNDMKLQQKGQMGVVPGGLQPPSASSTTATPTPPPTPPAKQQ